MDNDKEKKLTYLCGWYTTKPHEGKAPHTCPYSEEINGDSETLCTCCDACEQSCILDI